MVSVAYTPPPFLDRLPMRLRVFFLRLIFHIFMLVDKRHHAFPYTRTRSIRTSDGSTSLKLLLYDPPTSSPGPKPVHINFHGSGFIFPALGTNGRFCTMLAEHAGCIVIDADYRKAPEHPYPTPLADCKRVLEWVLRNEDGEFDTSRVTASGFSAGGNLVLALTQEQGEDGGPIKALAVFYPPTDSAVPYGERQEPPKKKDGGAIPAGDGELMRLLYLGPSPLPDLRDPLLSPLYSNPANFPGEGRTFIITVEYDWLDAEGREFADKLKEAGREPVYIWGQGLGHGFDVMCDEGTEMAKKRDEIYMKVVEVVKKGHARGKAQ